jgi:uncharacterized membrane protein YgcG
MPGDYSRKTFNRALSYSGVLMQQGRVQLDADWNEQLDIQLYRTETQASDVIGRSGVSKHENGFAIAIGPGGRDLTIAPGRIYVDGLLCELDRPATYTAQPFFPNPPDTTSASSPLGSPPGGSGQLNLGDGRYLVVLDAWQREVTALDDRLIREVALGGPDTAARLQTVFQIKLLRASPASPLGAVTCDSPIPEFDEYTKPPTGLLNARTQAVQPQQNPCLLPPSAGYTRLENQLYRVEVHKGGQRDAATFKWSRDNATIESTVENIADNIVTVVEIGKDDATSFAAGQWVEPVDDESSLKRMPHDLIQIDAVDRNRREVKLKSSLAALQNRPGLKLRRWEQTGASAAADGVKASSANWIDLEDGIQIQFSAGSYRSGDYWLLPARTSTGELEWPPFRIPNLNPLAQPPKGVRHRYGRLAIIDVSGGVVVTVEDCRDRFPSLTTICAEDVCYDNSKCDLSSAETVQDALDQLCAGLDLRFHNKHLHGWGIVCGLQVECGPDPAGQLRRHVTVRKGYAIDCDGEDVRVDHDEKVDLMSLIARTQSPPGSPMSSPLGTIADTEVCLILDADDEHGIGFRVEPYKAESNEFLKGTLLLDFWEDCIVSLIDLFKEEFSEDANDPAAPVGPALKRLITLFNLLVQLWDSQHGPFVYLSGEKGQTGKNFEDTILRAFYEKLRAKLHSHTFCAMFDGARQFPEYPYSGLQIPTIFGKGFQKRLRIAPGGKVGYTIGGNNKINVFDFDAGEMVEELEPPFPAGSIVQDVAFSQDGSEMYAVATLNDKDSFFVVADVEGLTHSFRTPTIICDILVVTLGTSPTTSGNVYAIGLGKGLYEINPGNVTQTPAPKYAFNAAGHLVIDDRTKRGFATANTASAATDRYTVVQRLQLDAQQTATFTLGAGPGEDDIVLSLDGARLFAVAGMASTTTNKSLEMFDVTGGSGAPQSTVSLGDDTTIRLAHLGDLIAVTYEDSHRIGLVTANNAVVPNYRHPVQVAPISIQVAASQGRAYVLNYQSNTITSIPVNRLQPGGQLNLQLLVDYRAAVLNAYADLLAGFLQYLKDCFCDHLAVSCPTCDEEDKLYLACIRIKDGQVYKVCNFSKRRYVKTFPTVGYWLSAIPIIPLIKHAVAAFCCAALPMAFGRFSAAKPRVPTAMGTGAGGAGGGGGAPGGGGAGGGGGSGGEVIGGGGLVFGGRDRVLKAARIRQGITVARQTEFKGLVREQAAKIKPAQAFLGDLLKGAEQPRVSTPPMLTAGDIAGQPVDEARTKLEAAGVVVDKVEEYDPSKVRENLLDVAAAPARLTKDSRVKLVTREGKVMFYSRVPAPAPAVDALRDEVGTTRAAIDETGMELDEVRSRIAVNAADLATKASVDDTLRLREEISGLRAEMAQAQTAHQQALVARDREIAELKGSSRDLLVRMRELQAAVERMTASRPAEPGEPQAGRPTPPPRGIKRKKERDEG